MKKNLWAGVKRVLACMTALAILAAAGSAAAQSRATSRPAVQVCVEEVIDGEARY